MMATLASAIANSNSCKTEWGRERKEELMLEWVESRKVYYGIALWIADIATKLFL